MTLHGILVALVSIAGLIVFVLRLTMRGRLYVGYAVIWVTCLASAGVLLLVRPLMRFMTVAVGAIFPVSAVTLVALIFIFLVLIYFSCQLTILSNRITAMAQYIALRELGEPKTASGGPHRGLVG